MKPKRKQNKEKTHRIIRVKTTSRVGQEPIVMTTPTVKYERPYWIKDPEDDMRF